MPSIRLMGFAAGTLFILSSAGHAQTPQSPGKALPMGQAPSKVLPHPQGRARGFRLGTVTRAPRATTTPGAATPRLAGATTAAGMPAARPAIPRIRVRLRSARLQPGRPRRAVLRAGRPPRPGLRRTGHGYGRGRGRPRRAGIRDRGAARPGRRRLGPRALTVPRSSDHPAGARRPGPAGSLGDGGGQLMGAAVDFRAAGGR